jgi:hypothetical protein
VSHLYSRNSRNYVNLCFYPILASLFVSRVEERERVVKRLRKILSFVYIRNARERRESRLENTVIELESSKPLEVLWNFSIIQYFHFPSFFPSSPENPLHLVSEPTILLPCFHLSTFCPKYFFSHGRWYSVVHPC